MTGVVRVSVGVVRVAVRVWQGCGKVYWCSVIFLFVYRFLKQTDGCHG